MKIPSPKRPIVAANDTGSSGVPALERGLAMLEILAHRPEGLTLSELTAALDLSPASAHRITGTLEEAGYLRREEVSRRYTLTRKLLLLSQPRGESRSLVAAAAEAMRAIQQHTGETTQLCCLADDRCVMIDQLASLHPFKYIVDLGCHAPLHCTAPGKAIIAFLPDAEQDALLSRLKLEKHTEKTIVTKRDFATEIERIRTQGYAFDKGEHFDGIHCVAAPILDQHGYAIGAVTIAGPSSRFPATSMAERGQFIREEANRISRAFLS
ncbi:MAG: IclR family transcriptional regulator [Verrucomicrobiota bacterium]